MVLSFNRWVGKVAVVTGASSGIGVAIVKELVEQGATVAGLARRVERVDELAKKLTGKKGKLYPIQADITKEDDILKAFKQVEDNLGPDHILVNNAGVMRHGRLADLDTQSLRQVLDTNVLGLTIATREAVKSMKKNNINGHIIHINSISGHTVPQIPMINIYPATKHAVTALTETLRQELNSLGTEIKVTSVSPGRVVSEMTTESPNEERRKIASRSPLLDAEDIADGVIYVLSTPEHVQVHELTIKPIGEPF